MTKTPIPWNFPPYETFLEIGGVIDIAVMTDTEDTLASHAQTLSSLLEKTSAEQLMHLVPTPLDESTFHGDWYDPEKGLLVFNNHVSGPTPKRPEDRGPYFIDLKTAKSEPTAFLAPQGFGNGQFAYAFTQPPYPLTERLPKVQELYTTIISEICPKGDANIFKWHSKELVEVAPELGIGTEWWGVFAFTTYIKSKNKIFAMLAATTD